MNNNLFCPLCGNELEHTQQYTDGRTILEEEHLNCSCGLYFYSYEYGYTEIMIIDKWFDFYFDTPEDEKNKTLENMQVEIDKYKSWKKESGHNYWVKNNH
jgi:hypothetical protein